jgi:hypothetical protein
MRAYVPTLAFLIASCSLTLDFDNEKDLPCPCLPDYVCLVAANRCAKKNSVDDNKSCTFDAQQPDDLCQPMSTCVDRGQGPKCLKRCTPTTYTTAESGARLAAECPQAKTCWPIPAGGGVCDQGECSTNPDTCGNSQTCNVFNGAGICFTNCQIFHGDACAGPDLGCHPVGDSSSTACLPTGKRMLGDLCNDDPTDSNGGPCAKYDGTPQNRAMICDTPLTSGTPAPLRCLAICNPTDSSACLSGKETCQRSRPRIDALGDDLGVCVPN